MVIAKLEDESLEPSDVLDDFIDDTDLDEEEEPHRLLLYQPYRELKLQPIISKPSRKQYTVQASHQLVQQRKTSRHRQQRVPENDMIYSEEDDGYSENDMLDVSAEGKFISIFTLHQRSRKQYERGFPYYFLWANQWKTDIKIFKAL